MNRDIENVLKNFDAVWKRVLCSKGQGEARACPMLPRKKQGRSKRRFEFGK